MNEEPVSIRVALTTGTPVEVAIASSELARLDDLLERRRRGAVLVKSDCVHTAFHGGDLELSVLDVESYHRLG